MGQEEKYQVLDYHDDSCSDQESNTTLDPLRRNSFLVRNRSFLSVVLVLIPSILLNIFLSSRHLNILVKQENVISEFSGLAYDTPVQYQSFTDYWGDNDTLADELWNPIPGDPIEVALSPEYVKSHGLKEAVARFPWDNDKGLYVIKAYHQIHCLKILRQAFVEVDRGLERAVDKFHVQHCLDSLRQDIMCLGDDTLMAIPDDTHRIGDGEVRQCRDWNKLSAWAVAPERNACFRQLSDVTPTIHTLEKHAFCPEGSKYYPVMKEYFEKHGHKDPFVL